MHIVRLVLVGEPSSGKSSIINRYDKNEFCTEKLVNSSSGVDYATREIRIANPTIGTGTSSASLLNALPNYSPKSLHRKLTTTVKLQVWDFAGHDRYKSMNKLFFNRAHGVLIVVDVMDEGAIDRLEKRVYDARQDAPANSAIVLCAAKLDLLTPTVTEVNQFTGDCDKTAVTSKSPITRLKEISKKLDIDLYLTSAATGDNIDRMFLDVATKIHQKQVAEKGDRCSSDGYEYSGTGADANASCPSMPSYDSSSGSSVLYTKVSDISNSSSSAGLLSSSGRIPSYGCADLSAGSSPRSSNDCSPRSSNDWAPYRAQDSPRIGKKSVIGKERGPPQFRWLIALILATIAAVGLMNSGDYGRFYSEYISATRLEEEPPWPWEMEALVGGAILHNNSYTDMFLPGECTIIPEGENGACPLPATKISLLAGPGGSYPAGVSWSLLHEDETLLFQVDESHFTSDAITSSTPEKSCEKFVSLACLNGHYVLYVDSVVESVDGGSVNVCGSEVRYGQTMDLSVQGSTCFSHPDVRFEVSDVSRNGCPEGSPSDDDGCGRFNGSSTLFVHKKMGAETEEAGYPAQNNTVEENHDPMLSNTTDPEQPWLHPVPNTTQSSSPAATTSEAPEVDDPMPQDPEGMNPTVQPTLSPVEFPIGRANITKDPTDPLLPPSDPEDETDNINATGSSLPSNVSSTGPLRKEPINATDVQISDTALPSMAPSRTVTTHHPTYLATRSPAHVHHTPTTTSSPMKKEEKHQEEEEEKDQRLPIKIACVGDSLTYGFGASSASHNYPSNLQNLLGGDFVVRDYGVDGVTAQKEPHTREGSYWDKKFYKKSHDFLPDVVLIMLGTNDSKEPNWNSKKYEADLRDLVRSYKILDSRPDVYLMAPPRALPTKQCKMMKVEREVIHMKIPEIMQHISLEEKTHLIRLTDIFVYEPEHPDTIYKKTDARYWTYDGIHPNDSGYARLSQKIFEGLNRKSYYGKYIPRLDEDMLLALMLEHKNDIKFDPTLPNPEEDRWHIDGTEEDKVEGYPYPNYSNED